MSEILYEVWVTKIPHKRVSYIVGELIRRYNPFEGDFRFGRRSPLARAEEDVKALKKLGIIAEARAEEECVRCGETEGIIGAYYGSKTAQICDRCAKLLEGRISKTLSDFIEESP